MKEKWCRWVVILAIGCMSITGCVPSAANQENLSTAPAYTASPPIPATPTEEKPEQTSEAKTNEESPVPEQTTSRFPEQRLSLMAVGDIMMHQEQLDAAWNPATKKYDFHPFFTNVVPMFKEADWVIGNLETTMSGSATGYSGYPMFNSPAELSHTLKDVGFTAVSTANNHSLDRKEPGILQTIKHLDEAGLLHTGTFTSPEERDEPLLLRRDGFTLALLSYTYGTNGIPIPEGKPYMINLIDPELIKKDIARAREKGADLVAVALHFGVEYQRLPNEAQKKTAEQCIQFGADLILGAHPHVVQPYEWKTVTMEDGREHKGLITYSLGNFISAQRWDYKDVGAILKLTLHKGESGVASIESAEMIPTYVHFFRKSGKRNYVIYPVPQTLAKLQQGEKYPTLTKDAIAYMKRLKNEMPVHVNTVVSTKKAS
ncbi:CapA family protein [Brevibacillus choshinensis]|uniref:CapA family protein n=1 Tax=Brevibacillus choshinensis TaxID=54911 RepID=UPI002E229259|nr:CapA family protein [Brevibacillus choshinensis]MED4784576.1 CapA family protein [Brevibacillus choshinensis]